MHYKHILLPNDGSELSRKAEKECTAFAKSTGARVTVLHVVSHFHLSMQPWGAPRSVHTKIEKEHEEDATNAAQTMISAITARIKAEGVKCDGLVVVGDQPFEEIVNSAQKCKCDLIMMASHGRRGLDGILLGSETQKVLTHTKIPVLVVK